ncbi:MAG TPA: hypothetical protein VFI13_09800, partial [Gemmatimonadales bacterium]|nr:hypothetical protein [Gemmatimonadales bacterium]
SVGAIEAAPSNPDVIYAGMGDMVTGGAINEGNGVWKSTDAGQSWQHMGLDATKQIPSILVDPRNPDLVLVAAQGDLHVRNDQRGVFRSTDGGRTWTRTLYVDDTTGIQKITWAYDHPEVMFATTVKHYVQPGPPAPFNAGGGGPNAPTNTRLFKSTDEGVTWHEITGGGLPHLAGRTSVAVAMTTNAQRVFLVANSGLYRSDDGGATWRQMDATDRRVANGQGGYNCGVYVDPKDPDVVYLINTSSYVSRDGGNTFTGFKGAPGGDDPQQMWIDPTDGQRIFLGMDQGATISLDGGKSWSSWYNQSTDQVYHLSVDNSFPAWVYAPQQDAGAVRTRVRGNFGEITPLDWSPVGTWEWGTVLADPLNPNIVYGSGSGILKISYPSEQIVNVGPNADPGAHLRTSFSMPMQFAPWDQHELLAGFQYVMASNDGGATWRKLSPDLGYPKGVTPPPEDAPPPAPGAPPAPRGGAIETLSASTAMRGVIWVGTSNGLVKMTRNNGVTWTDVSVPGIHDASFATISTIDASHTNPAEAYVAIDLHRLGDYAPYFYRTTDWGRTWTKITDGLPVDEVSGSFARVIRADTRKAGLLFAGTESGMYVSFDDGGHWRSMRGNLPNTSYRDAVIHGNDLIVGTYGRGLWVLDDISALRQMTPATEREAVHLYAPGAAVRLHRNVNQDTPYPPEVPHAENPPEGAVFYYSLTQAPAGPLTIDVLDASGAVVRHLSSVPAPLPPEAATPPNPDYWTLHPQALPTTPGLHQVNWDLRHDDPPAFRHSYGINANPHGTPASPEGPLVAPGRYTLKLTVDGRSYTQPVTVTNDPRSPATALAVAAEHKLQMDLANGMRTAYDGYQAVAALRAALAPVTGGNGPAEVVAAAKALDAHLDSLAGSTGGGFGRRGGRGTPPPAFVDVNGVMSRQLDALDNGDVSPTGAMKNAYAAACGDLKTVVTAWRTVNTTTLPALNAQLAAAHLAPLPVATDLPAVPVCARASRPDAAAELRRGNANANDDDPDADPDFRGDDE